MMKIMIFGDKILSLYITLLIYIPYIKSYINLIWTCTLNFKIKLNNILRKKINSHITKITPFRVCKEISRRKFNHFKENSSCWNPPPWWKLITHVCKLCWWHLVAVVIGIKYPNIHERRFFRSRRHFKVKKGNVPTSPSLPF